jgi:hypothetical protein
MTDHTFDIVVSTRDNHEWIETYLLSYIKFTSDPYKYNIHILDSSIEENYITLVDIIDNFDLNIFLKRYSRDIHYHNIWTNGISLCNNDFILITHADIIYLYKNWDLFLLDKINSNYNLISVSVRTKKYPESVFILSEKSIFTDSNFDHSMIDKKLIEHGLILENQKKTSGLDFYIKDSIYYKMYGDIVLLEDKDFLYHSYYSSRIKPESSCPIPDGPEKNYILNREPFDKTIERLKLFLKSSESLSLKNFL